MMACRPIHPQPVSERASRDANANGGRLDVMLEVSLIAGRFRFSDLKRSIARQCR